MVRSTNRKMTYTLGLPPEMLAAATATATGARHEAGSQGPGGGYSNFIVPPEAKENVVLGRLKLMDHFLGKIIPYRGSWVEFEYDTKNLLYVRITASASSWPPFSSGRWD